LEDINRNNQEFQIIDKKGKFRKIKKSCPQKRNNSLIVLLAFK
jgi:hypothetical protein